MNDVSVRVLVPVDATMGGLEQATSTAPAGFEEVRETLPGIFSLKALKHQLCKRRYWNPQHYRFILRTLEEDEEDEFDNDEGDAVDLLARSRGARGQAARPMADRKEGAAGIPKRMELYRWLQDEDVVLSELDLGAPSTQLFLEGQRQDGSWPTDRYDPVKSRLQQERLAARRLVREKRRARKPTGADHDVEMDSSAAPKPQQEEKKQQTTTTATKPAGQSDSSLSSWIQKGRNLLSDFTSGGGWYDDEDEWEKPPSTTTYSAPPGYQMSEEEQLQAAMMLSSAEAQEDSEKEQDFEALLLSKGLTIKKISDDGNCLFGAVADQAYGDPSLHAELRKLCLDYMEKDRDHFSQFVTEDFEVYILRKRCLGVYANNPEIQALSEMLARPIEVYSYSAEPMNTFQGAFGAGARPIRISYHRGNHYNSLRLLDSAEEDKLYGSTAPPPALPVLSSAATKGSSGAPSSSMAASGGDAGANVCFLCGQACVEYEDLQIHMFTTCEKRDLL